MELPTDSAGQSADRVSACEGVDLVNAMPTAAEVIERIIAQAVETLTIGAKLVR